MSKQLKDVIINEHPIEACINGNPRLKCTINRGENVELFSSLVRKKGFHNAVKKVLGKPPKPSLDIIIKTKIKQIIFKK